MVGSATDLNQKCKTFKIRELPEKYKKYIHDNMSFQDGQIRYLLCFAEKRDEITLVFNRNDRIICWASVSHKMSYGKLMGSFRKQVMAWTDRRYRKRGLAQEAIKIVTEKHKNDRLECFHPAIYNALHKLNIKEIIGHF